VKLPHGGESGDVVDLQLQRVRHHRPDPWDPDQPLRVGRREHAVSQLTFDAADLRLQQRVLLGAQCRLEARQLRQLRRRRDVVLLEERTDTALAAEHSTHQDEAGAEQITGFAERGADHVRLGNQIDAQELRERGRVDGHRFSPSRS
jgi:hypothetical protein